MMSLLSIVLISASAWAQEATPTAASAPSTNKVDKEIEVVGEPLPDIEEIEVFGNPLVAKARDELHVQLRTEGYTHTVRKGDTVVYRNETPWMPDVIVHDDGWVYVKRTPVRVHAPGKSFAGQGAPLAYLLCLIPVVTPGCISIGGQLISPAKLGEAKGDVLAATHPEVEALADAVTAVRMQDRINDDIPVELDRIWSQALPASDRKAEILAFWDSRNENTEGDRVRKAIEAYINGVIQQSPDAFTPEEIAAFNAHHQSDRTLQVRYP